jgi:regulator of RNase E activity RraB
MITHFKKWGLTGLALLLALGGAIFLLMQSRQETAVKPKASAASGQAEAAVKRPAQPINSPFPPSELPYVVTDAGVRASLGYLAQNGADLTRPMPSKHHVFAVDVQTADQFRAWAKSHGYEVRNAETVRDHQGQPHQAFDLVRIEVPLPENIEREGRQILEAVQQIPGTYYQTWSGEIVRK